LVFAREIENLRKRIGGVQELNKIPDAIYIVDFKQEKTARMEAEKKGVKLIGPCDTNIDPTGIDYPIPANDDAVKSVDLITKIIAEAVKEGKELAAKTPQIKEQRPKTGEKEKK
jgi:small subunit ribosomal protein S2